MFIERDLLISVGVKPKLAAKYIFDFQDWLSVVEIVTPLRVIHFGAQVFYESSMLTRMEENLNYSAKRLREVFPTKFPNDEIANEYAKKPEKIANRVYANRYGNGDEVSGDGWRYRGRGALQLTFAENYRRFSRWAGEPSLNPDSVSDGYAIESAAFFWDWQELNRLADADDLEGITRVITGGKAGIVGRAKIENELQARAELLERLRGIIV